MNKESVVSAFFHIEKSYNIMRKDGLVIKLNQIRIKGWLLTRVKELLSERTIILMICFSISIS